MGHISVTQSTRDNSDPSLYSELDHDSAGLTRLLIMTSWNPQPAGLQEILRTIHESTDMNPQVQRNITQVGPSLVFECQH